MYLYFASTNTLTRPQSIMYVLKISEKNFANTWAINQTFLIFFFYFFVKILVGTNPVVKLVMNGGTVEVSVEGELSMFIVIENNTFMSVSSNCSFKALVIFLDLFFLELGISQVLVVFFNSFFLSF